MNDPPAAVDGAITDPDAALDALLAAAKGAAHTTREDDAQRLAEGVRWLDGHLRAGGALPTVWAAAPDGADDTRPVTDVPLPGDQPGPGLLMAMAGTAAGEVSRSHRPGPPGAGPVLTCLRCGEAWPCDPAVLAAALTRARPARRWLDARRGDIADALTIAARTLDGAGQGCPDCGCPDPRCGDSTWDHPCEAQRTCPAHAGAARAAARYRTAKAAMPR